MPEQKPIIELLASSEPALSVEFFPPKSQEGVETLVDAATRIASRKPDFVSVTHGAGGSTRDLSASVSQRMKNDIDLQVMPHLTCVGSTKEELETIIDGFHRDGYRNIMALRGDPPQGGSYLLFEPTCELSLRNQQKLNFTSSANYSARRFFNSELKSLLPRRQAVISKFLYRYVRR